MDKTTYRISDEKQEVYVSFDLRNDEDCVIELSFSKDDVLNILNMEVLSKNKIDVAGIEGFASLNRENLGKREICFSYRNGYTVNSGTVFYSYKRLSALLNKAFTELNSK